MKYFCKHLFLLLMSKRQYIVSYKDRKLLALILAPIALILAINWRKAVRWTPLAYRGAISANIGAKWRKY